MNCGGSKLEVFINLGEQPNGNYFPTYEELDKEPRYPCAMAVCQACWQVQIMESPSAESMFSNHPYITGVNMPVVSHFNKIVEDVLTRYEIPENSLVLDIGANDGTLLSIFRSEGMRVLGIDPGIRTGRLAKKNGITICETFWGRDTAQALDQLKLIPDLITATAVFYHVEDIHSFVEGLSLLMAERTLFLVQCVYLKDLVEKFQFDHFYHEHTMIHAIAPLKNLFSKYGLRMLDVRFYPVHGGSFVLYVGREESPYETSPVIEKTIIDERASGLQDLSTYVNFATQVEGIRDELVTLLKALRTQGKSVYALGAPLKGSTLLNYCGIGPELVELATEVNPFKIGKFTPGTHIPILFEDAIEKQPDYYLVLSWNFIDFFVDKYAEYLKAGGFFILPHPQVKVIGKTLSGETLIKGI